MMNRFLFLFPQFTCSLCEQHVSALTWKPGSLGSVIHLPAGNAAKCRDIAGSRVVGKLAC
jgi:hypothetical protein